MLEGLLVDLVPYGRRFFEHDYAWNNGEGAFWGSMGGRQIVSRATIERWQREWLDSEEPRSGIIFGVQTKDGKPLGDFTLNFILPAHRAANLGAVIGEPDYWGGGYGTDALLLLVEYAFDWLDLRRVWLNTMALNARVLRQMEKVGFTLEARQREATYVYPDWVDVLQFGLLREEWPGRAALIERLGLRVRDE